MRGRTGKRTGSTNKRQSKIDKISGPSVEVKEIVRNNNIVTITFNTITDAVQFHNEFNATMEVDTALVDYPEDDMSGVLRTLKVDAKRN